MREIIFRGKSEISERWVVGDLAQWRGDDICICEEYNSTEKKQYAVIPETVGQYTGLADKNGKRIFEEDIVKSKKYGKIIGHSNVNDFDIFTVAYEPAMFRIKNAHRAFNLVGRSVDYEVIGNIHDNPELLKGE